MHKGNATAPDVKSRSIVTRLVASQILIVVGIIATNWWVLIPFRHGISGPHQGFFSDLEATGEPDASLYRSLDFLASLLTMIALALRGPLGRVGERRAEFPWIVIFAVAGMAGSLSPYSCAEGTYPACRRLEWHFQLPMHQYLHIASGVVEFAAMTIAIELARLRTRGEFTPEGRAARGIIKVLFVAYPALAVAYLADAFGAFIEPVFFLAFSAMLLLEVFEPQREHDGDVHGSVSYPSRQ
ncbi:MAG: DUF998 domain-containing protein [Actinomycetota bacterium]